MVAFKWWTSGLADGKALCFALTVAAGALASPVWAQAPAPAVTPAKVASEDACTKDDVCREHYNKAIQFYKQEYFEEALPEFKAAYDARQMSVLLINIGRTLQKLGRPREALAYYDRFQKAESRPDPDTAKRVQQYIGECRALVDESAVGAAASGPPPPPPKPGKPLIIAGGVLAGLGVGGIIAGGVLGAQASSAFDEYSSTVDEFAKLDARDTTKQLQLGAGIAGISGAVLAATGGTLIAIGVIKNRAAAKDQGAKTAPAGASAAAPSARLLPSLSIGASGFSVALRGGF